MKFKIPNYLTIGRIIIVPIFVFTFYLPGFYGDVIPFALFLIASFTDFLDGLLARMFKEESKLGELLDPIADKIIVATALILLVMDQTIKNYDLKAGMVLNPATPISTINSILPELDLVLLMSVNPGFGGQKFVESTIPKIKKLRKKIDSLDKEIRLEVDGGISKENIVEVSRAGADTFVAGSAIFNTKDYKDTISNLKSLID